MIKKNYIEEIEELKQKEKMNEQPNLHSYSYSTYSLPVQYETNLTSEYRLPLPANLDIFTLLPSDLFKAKNPNGVLISSFLKEFRKELINFCDNKTFNNELPKLTVRNDEFGATIIEWNYSFFRIYFSFEKDANDNNYGIVENNKETGEFFSKSGMLTPENYSFVTSQLIDYVMRNT